MSAPSLARWTAPPRGPYAVLRDPAVMRSRMVAAQLSQRALARRAGVSGGFVSHLMPPAHSPSARPRRRYLLASTAQRLAEALGCTTGELFELRAADDPSTGPLPVVISTR